MKAATVRVERTRLDRCEYRADMHPVLVSYFAQENLTDVQIAARLHIGRSTLNAWRKRYSELAQALKDSKEIADAQITAPAGKGMSVNEVTQRYADAVRGILEGDSGCTPKKEEGQ